MIRSLLPPKNVFFFSFIFHRTHILGLLYLSTSFIENEEELKNLE